MKAMPDWEVVSWPRASHFARVFHIRCGSETGTAFVIDVDGRQYLISARHVVAAAEDTASIELHRNGTWTAYVVTVVGKDDVADISILSLQERLVGPGHAVEVNAAGCRVGQTVFFLGYPLGLRGPNAFTPEFPVALVGRGTLATFSSAHSPPGAFLSANAPPGFSGAPIFFVHSESGNATLFAILIQSYAYEMPTRDPLKNPNGSVLVDSGIVGCVFISHALALIRANPVGYRI
jgi:S1-C subfamily serine protease